MGNIYEPFTLPNDCAARNMKATLTLDDPTANSTSSVDDALFYVPPGLVAVLSVIYGLSLIHI